MRGHFCVPIDSDSMPTAIGEHMRLVVGASQELPALKLTVVVTAAEVSKENVYAGMIEPIVDRMSPGNRWYLFAAPKTAPVFVYGFLKRAAGPQVATGPIQGVDGVANSVVFDFGVGAVDWRGGWFNPRAHYQGQMRGHVWSAVAGPRSQARLMPGVVTGLPSNCWRTLCPGSELLCDQVSESGIPGISSTQAHNIVVVRLNGSSHVPQDAACAKQKGQMASRFETRRTRGLASDRLLQHLADRHG